jgi:hypothetical protein
MRFSFHVADYHPLLIEPLKVESALCHDPLSEMLYERGRLHMNLGGVSDTNGNDCPPRARLVPDANWLIFT